MSRLTEEQLKSWVFGLRKLADEVSELLDKPSVSSYDVAELTGYAKSSLALLSEKDATEYHKKHSVQANTKPLRKLAPQIKPKKT